jgi:regulator of cell morphogenesis and NO signaling
MQPGFSRKLGIDYCCGGHKSLQEACATANISVDDVVRSLQAQSELPPRESLDWRTVPITELMDHILQKHHVYVKTEAPRLQTLLAKVVGVHGNNHPELRRVQAAFGDLANELASHLMKEEQILFPYLKQAASRNECGPSCFGSVQNPIRVMMMEHDGAGEKLREIREATNNYALPEDACFSYSTLFSAFQEFEKDLHEHIHLENNILFPRAIEMDH